MLRASLQIQATHLALTGGEALNQVRFWRLVAILILIQLTALLAPPSPSPVNGQRLLQREELHRPQPSSDTAHREGEFTFARLRYSTIDPWSLLPGDAYYNRYASWATDYPKADHQFIHGLRGWVRSSLDISDNPVAVSLHGKEIFNYPFLYVVEPGYLDLTREEATSLREYLLRGGFVILDDFWGVSEWENVRHQLVNVFPEYQLRQLYLDHPLFHSYFEISEILQTPNFQNIVYRGRTAEKGGMIPSYWGLFDDQERLMVFVGRNLDNGDAWEWIDDPRYPLKYGLGAYRIGTNVIFYAMTH